MFTGIIEEIGRVAAVDVRGADRRLSIEAPLVCEGLRVGDSVAVSGPCLTVDAIGDDGFQATITPETIERSTLGRLRPGSRVNLERALRLGDRLSGHLVAGHVDAVGEITDLRPEGDGAWLAVRYPRELAPFIVPKGSIAVDGISLTPVEVSTDRFTVALVRHTLEATTLGSARVGDAVNLEADLLARYVQRLLGRESEPPAGLTEERLREHGFR
ncbi:riboflavin synthase subunit alpha [candidate division KD3-62 bacterium DG_56]|uniref:Riboflavin synthase n=1 Tax=candidate division KD3-62 bacterium DG_56 TaxID=1704032 RepID=A0A0S7XPL0_9BACT|nr:MAG: riboflavin synthase subunit alpha [candidate division KD3-62 bacterium DG_56]